MKSNAVYFFLILAATVASVILALAFPVSSTFAVSLFPTSASELAGETRFLILCYCAGLIYLEDEKLFTSSRVFLEKR